MMSSVSVTRVMVVPDPSALDLLQERVDALERRTSDLADQIEEQRTRHEVLRRDVTWIVRVSMGAAAVISTVVSLAARLL